jgi:hypothetical protein|tara:strand:- start:254 stop:505 length:252 start_codon:yes stop_codon:yes gene_type:complete
MNKKEKYINYIVADLVKNTEIDYDQEIIKYPYHLTFSPSYPLLHPYTYILLSKYIKEIYGARDEEIEIIWKLYKERIESLYKK